MSDDNLNLLDEADAIAPEYGVFHNIGKVLSVASRLIRWDEGHSTFVECDAATWKALASKSANGRIQKKQEVRFLVDVQEFRPALSFQYERRVNVPSADWNTTVRPSLEKVLGKHETQAALVAALVGRYVDVVDVDSKSRAKDGKTYHAPKFVRVFETAEAARAAVTASTRANPTATESAAGSQASPQPAAPANSLEKFRKQIAGEWEAAGKPGAHEGAKFDAFIAHIVYDYACKPREVRELLGV